MDRTTTDSKYSGCCLLAFWSLTVAVMYLMQYMALDFYSVRIRRYPNEGVSSDWLILLFPVLPAVAQLCISHTRVLRLEIAACIASLCFGMVLAAPLIATVGIWFHFMIGGTI